MSYWDEFAPFVYVPDPSQPQKTEFVDPPAIRRVREEVSDLRRRVERLEMDRDLDAWQRQHNEEIDAWFAKREPALRPEDV